ncbi:MAG TPA: [protein-PII] uridylyltransferase [Mycobacteriales bacterium]|nr:[protein-PII] uridylyltransferase [Mycobacteriales bacterium]
MSDVHGSAAVQLRATRDAVLGRPELTGGELRAELTRATDRWLAERLGAAPGVALVAVGGYGRAEPAAGSDLDLLLVHRAGTDAAGVADALWYPIWDAGVGLDHAVRTVDQAIEVARHDLRAALGLLDSRPVAGDAALFSELHTRAYGEWRRDARRRVPELIAAVRSRTERFGELAFLLEPDLKEARGGLRDIHAVHALAAAWLVDPPSPAVVAAYEWLLDVRGELHRRNPRSDRLVQQEHDPVAAALGLADGDELIRSVSSAARRIAFAADEAIRRTEAARPASRPWNRRRAQQRRPLADGVVAQDGWVQLSRDADPGSDPGLVWRVAAAAAESGLPIGAHALARLEREAAALPDPWPGDARQALIATLGAGRPAIGVFEALDQAGLLVRVLPEWAAVRCRPQHNPVHRYTVDRHLIETAAEASALTRRVARPDLLLLGALLHDIGKGYPGDHTDAGVGVVPTIAARIGFEPADIATLTRLVRHHLLLPDTATRRDLTDPATIETVADAVGDRATLDLLHALTVADAAATGPAAWSEWKAGLVDQLVDLVRADLAGEPAPPLPALDESQLALASEGELAVQVTGLRVTVVAPDHPGLLWRWSGALALQRLEIRSAVAASAGSAVGPMGVTVFDVAPRFGTMPDVALLRAAVRRAYDDPAALAGRLTDRERTYAPSRRRVSASPRVVWFDDASRTATVVEVRAHDADGLLYRLTKALAEAGLDVRTARIHTMGAEAVDTFYVVDEYGGPVADDVRRERIEYALLAACEAAAG